ncbi:MAG TPA: outer membrane beta-barrel protein, partial [Blastocatellia bacterium]|nr:outer membrane beta-barrel protein [Blastocatellia bacterium]
RKLLILLAVLFVAHVPAQAQESYPVVEIFGGYSYLSAEILDDREGLGVPGFIVSVAGNPSPYIGIVGEISGHYGNVTRTGVTPDPQFDADVYYFLFGPRFTARRGNINLFAHTLIGAARTKVEFADSETDFAFAIGGGMDINASKEIAVRLFQVDYAPIRANGDTAHNFRFALGFVYRFVKE